MKFYEFLTSPDLCGSEFTGASWAVHREVIARLWDGDPDLIPPEYHSVARLLLGCELPQPGAPGCQLASVSRAGRSRMNAFPQFRRRDRKNLGGLLKPAVRRPWPVMAPFMVGPRPLSILAARHSYAGSVAAAREPVRVTAE